VEGCADWREYSWEEHGWILGGIGGVGVLVDFSKLRRRVPL
jgi:hypothetical protein